MIARLRSAALIGVDSHPIGVEVDVSPGLPLFGIVGLPDPTVRESRDRVRAAIRNSGFPFPDTRVTVNLSPGDIRKGGASYDVPIALSILAATGVIRTREVDDVVLLGELSLDGAVRPVNGVLPIAAAARKRGETTLLLPAANAREAAVVDGIRVWPVSTLTQAVAVMNSPESAPSLPPLPAIRHPSRSQVDLRDIRGQALPRRALEIAAAGRHNVLFIGPPGAGKTMLARRLPWILPPLTFEEALEATAVHSVAGCLPPGGSLVDGPPFRAPHHTSSWAALVGGGPGPRPGEISLAHHGVLFLDEMPEFGRRVLEVLRQPLEEGQVTLARAQRTVTFPARFQLVAAMNPCPCGFHGTDGQPCRCTPHQVAAYRGRLSGPLLDRIDLVVDVPSLPMRDITASPCGESSAVVQRRILAARTRQSARRGDRPSSRQPTAGPALAEAVALSPPAARFLTETGRRLKLSARAYMRTLRVARTIADLAASDEVAVAHVAEAVQYRFEL